MTDLLGQITPLSIGIIWLTDGPVEVEKKFYKDIDYLVNGLLTATKKLTPMSSNVMVGKNFGDNFYVFTSSKPEAKELIHFIDLLKPHLKDENSICLIDEIGAFPELKKSLSLDVVNKIQPIQ
jgi:SRSO17 transposase